MIVAEVVTIGYVRHEETSQAKRGFVILNDPFFLSLYSFFFTTPNPLQEYNQSILANMACACVRALESL